MQQMTLATGTLEPYRKATRRGIFPSEMDRVVPLLRQPADDRLEKWTPLCRWQTRIS
jgi:hypothetical protein